MFDRIIPGTPPSSATIWAKSVVRNVSETTAGFVLVGGQSSRMGRDKALLAWHDRSLVEGIAERVLSVAASVTLVGAPERYSTLPYPRIPDASPGCGPLGGIEAALASSPGEEFNLIVACDMPDLASFTTNVLQKLLAQAKHSAALCVAAQDSAAEGNQLHPLCAVYRAGSLPVIRECLRSGHLRLHDVFSRLGGEAWRLPGVLANVNTPEDWAAWQTR